jgi:nitroimidazol reductase NimA-like FMN-containing flavoprotein (pyridoxamine 5'-phosphate oxidase superfamily)
MLEIEEMGSDDINDLIETSSFGHLGCSRDDEPYVVPINYAFVEPHLYIYTTEGKKADILKSNPRVCLQIERIKDRTDWESVVIHANAHEVSDADEREKAVRAILKINPTLTPAISVQWMDDWVRENIEILFRLDISSKTGRKTAGSRAKFYAKFRKSPDKDKP